jgi:hypothetical protein
MELMFGVVLGTHSSLYKRSLLHVVADKVQKSELWIADRNFATLEFMFAIASKDACFIMRQHGSLKHWQTLGKHLAKRIMSVKQTVGKFTNKR